MSINASDSFPPALVAIEGATFLCGLTPTFSASQPWTNLTFFSYLGNTDHSGPYFISNSTVSYDPSELEIDYGPGGTFNNTFTGTISQLILGATESGSENSVYDLTINGIVEEIVLGLTVGQKASLSVTQTASFNIGVSSYFVDGTVTIDAANATSIVFLSGFGFTGGGDITFNLEAAACTTLTSPSSLTCSDGTLTLNGAFNQASVDALLVALANGHTGEATISIGGTSSTPSSTGLAAKATLVADGCRVTTN